jgi:hypothetical protein
MAPQDQLAREARAAGGQGARALLLASCTTQWSECEQKKRPFWLCGLLGCCQAQEGVELLKDWGKQLDGLTSSSHSQEVIAVAHGGAWGPGAWAAGRVRVRVYGWM